MDYLTVDLLQPRNKQHVLMDADIHFKKSLCEQFPQSTICLRWC